MYALYTYCIHLRIAVMGPDWICGSAAMQKSHFAKEVRAFMDGIRMGSGRIRLEARTFNMYFVYMCVLLRRDTTGSEKVQRFFQQAVSKWGLEISLVNDWPIIYRTQLLNLGPQSSRSKQNFFVT